MTKDDNTPPKPVHRPLLRNIKTEKAETLVLGSVAQGQWALSFIRVTLIGHSK